MYSYQSVSELRLALEDRGLDHYSKNKEVLIRRLEDDDEWRNAENARYKVIVRNISEMYSPCYKVYLEPTDTIGKLKKLIAEKTTINPECQVIYYNAGRVKPTAGDFFDPDEGVVGKVTNNYYTLADYIVHNEDIMYLRVTDRQETLKKTSLIH